MLRGLLVLVLCARASAEIQIISVSKTPAEDNRDVMRVAVNEQSSWQASDVFTTIAWPLPSSSPAVVYAYDQLHVFYDCAPPANLTTGVALCHQFNCQPDAFCLEIVDEGFSYGKFAAAVLAGDVLHVFSLGVGGVLRHHWTQPSSSWQSETLSRLCSGRHTAAVAVGEQVAVFSMSFDGGLCVGTLNQTSGAWTDFDLLDAADSTGQFPAAVVVGDDLWVLSNGVAGGVRLCVLGSGSPPDCSTWDPSGSTGTHVSVAMLNSVAHVFNYAAGVGLRHFVCEAASAACSGFETLDVGNSSGLFATSVVSDAGLLHVFSQSAGGSTIRHVMSADGIAWDAEDVDGGSQGTFLAAIDCPAVALEAAAAVPHIVRQERQTAPAALAGKPMREPFVSEPTTVRAPRIAASDSNWTLVCPATGSSSMRRLAVLEAQRYLYLRTGVVASLSEQPSNVTCTVAVIANGRDAIWSNYNLGPELAAQLTSLQPQEHLVVSVVSDQASCPPWVAIGGGDDLGTLYGVYKFAEGLDVRFYLHDDVIPDVQISIADLPRFDSFSSPLFEVRGIHPFHDFLEGPDLWSAEHYRRHISQISKMRMNFVGVHTYPFNYVGAEPAVWLGVPDDVQSDGNVSFGYPAAWQNSLRGTWGYLPMNTTAYAWGSAELFDRACYGDSAMSGDVCPLPQSPSADAEVFNRAAALLNEAFTFARQLGVKTCAGAEVPLAIPPELQTRLNVSSPDNDGFNPLAKGLLYEGIFERIKRSYPLDYFWMYTKELWLPYITPYYATSDEVKAVADDMLAAVQAARKVDAPFELSTCGWTVGPTQDPTLFGKLLPGDVAISSLVVGLGTYPVDPAYAQLPQRHKWPVLWLEDDASLTMPEVHVGRIAQQAQEALTYGATGLLGIHWRTAILSMNFAALSKCSWESCNREDLIRDWVVHQFGLGSATEQLVVIFTQIDGLETIFGDCPGALAPDPTPWSQVSAQYAFVDAMGARAPQITGAGNLARFTYWLQTLQYWRASAEVQCTWAVFNAAMDKVRQQATPALRKEVAETVAMPVRVSLVQQVTAAVTLLMEALIGISDLGTIMNWNQHIAQAVLVAPGAELAGYLQPQNLTYLGCFVDTQNRDLNGTSFSSSSMTQEACVGWCQQQAYRYAGLQFATYCFCGQQYGRYGKVVDDQCDMPCSGNPSEDCGAAYLNSVFETAGYTPPQLPENATAPLAYAGASHLVVPVVPSQLHYGEPLEIEALVLDSGTPESVTLFYRTIGAPSYSQQAFALVSGAVYAVTIPADQLTLTLEYYVQAEASTGTTLVAPATAPAISFTTVVN